MSETATATKRAVGFEVFAERGSRIAPTRERCEALNVTKGAYTHIGERCRRRSRFLRNGLRVCYWHSRCIRLVAWWETR